MDIRLYHVLAALTFIVLLNSCGKERSTCTKMGFEFTYSKPGVSYSPDIDSIALGTEITLTATAAKSFYEEEKKYTVTLRDSTIFGPLVIKKATGGPNAPIVGAASDVELQSLIGNVWKDSLNFTEEQLKTFRSVIFDATSTDSFRLSLRIKPKNRGTFFVALSQQYNRDKDCAVFRYFLKIKDTGQHLYLLQNVISWPVTESDSRYLYCFKVY